MRLFVGLPSSLKNWKDKFFFVEDTADEQWGGIWMSWNCMVDKRSSKLRLDAEEKAVVREIKAIV